MPLQRWYGGEYLKGKIDGWISNDLTSSYWQVRISEESQGITTFISEFGRFRWCVFPQGLSCSGDEFGQRLEIILSNYPKFTNFLRVVDDIAVFGESKEELEEQFSLFLDICREHHLTLSPKKFQMCDPDGFIKFAIMVLSSKGLSPDPDKMSAIRDFSIPINRDRPSIVVGSLSTVFDVVPRTSIVSKWSQTPSER